MTTRSEGLDMHARTVLITGATAGIGYQTARALAQRGAAVIITGRDASRGEKAAAAIQSECGPGPVRFLRADHSTVGGNQELADRVREAVPTLDVFVNNVGGCDPTRWETADSYEATLAMNVVGPFALTVELVPPLQAKRALALHQRRLGRIPDVQTRPVRGRAVDRALRQCRGLGADKAAEHALHLRTREAAGSRACDGERRASRPVLDPDDALDETGDDGAP